MPLPRPVPLVCAALALAAACGCPALPAAGAATTQPSWGWPLAPVPVVVAPFRAPAGPYAAGHRGVDLATAVGAVVRAAGPGTVAFAGPVAGRPVVSVDHPGGLRTTYEPVTPSLARGDPVARGDPLGTVAATPGHCLPATCLHWGLRRGEAYLDPLSLVGAGTAVRLLPVWVWSPGAEAPRAGQDRPPDRGPLLVADRLRAGRAGRSRAAGSRRGRCRRGRTGAGSRAPPRP